MARKRASTTPPQNRKSRSRSLSYNIQVRETVLGGKVAPADYVLTEAEEELVKDEIIATYTAGYERDKQDENYSDSDDEYDDDHDKEEHVVDAADPSPNKEVEYDLAFDVGVARSPIPVGEESDTDSEVADASPTAKDLRQKYPDDTEAKLVKMKAKVKEPRTQVKRTRAQMTDEENAKIDKELAQRVTKKELGVVKAGITRLDKDLKKAQLSVGEYQKQISEYKVYVETLLTRIEVLEEENEALRDATVESNKRAVEMSKQIRHAQELAEAEQAKKNGTGGKQIVSS